MEMADSWRTAKGEARAYLKLVLSAGYPDFLRTRVDRREYQRRRWGEFAILVEAKALELVFLGEPFVLRLHRNYHRGCAKLCAARNLYAFALLTLPRDLNRLALPLRNIIIPCIQEILGLQKLPDSFHRDVWRDLRILVSGNARKRLIARRYAGLVKVWIESGRRGPQLADMMDDPDLPAPARRFLRKALAAGTIERLS
jgi:hypothetical protein